MPRETVLIKKFLANNIKFVLDEKVAQARDETVRGQVLGQLRVAFQCGEKKLTRIISNTDLATVPQLAAAAQVLGVSVDDLIKLEDAPAC